MKLEGVIRLRSGGPCIRGRPEGERTTCLFCHRQNTKENKRHIRNAADLGDPSLIGRILWLCVCREVARSE